MLRQDIVSRSLIVLAVVLTLFLYVFVGLEPLITPILLLFGAGVIRIFGHAKKVEVDPTISQAERHDIVYYCMVSLLSMLVGGIFVENLFTPRVPPSVLAVEMVLVGILFSCLMAISEEQFFRGELLDLFASHSPVAKIPTAILVTAFGFWAYHLKVYGSRPDNLIYVLLAGIVLGWAAWKTQRVLTPIIAHILNNLLGSAFLLPAIIIVCAWAFVKYRRGKLVWAT